jgi:hypothetical protein
MIFCILGISVTLYFAGSPKRDAEKLHDFQIIAKNIGVGGKVCTSPEWDDWSMRYYLARYYQISVYGISMDCTHIIIQRNDPVHIPPEYHKADFSTLYYEVYKK